MFPSERVELPPWAADEFDERWPERNRVLFQMLGLRGDDPADVRQMVAIYYAMIRFIDNGIGQILDTLERLGLEDNTIIVFAADHGDFMGEHAMVVKGGVFYDCLVRVPLIVSWPGHVPQGKVDDSMVNTIDIAPTLLQLQELPVPFGYQGAPLPTVTDAAPRDAAFSEYGAGGPAFHMSDLERLKKPWGYRTLIECLQWREAEGRRKMVRTRDWKYVHDPMGDLDELYDLRNDPWELRNVAADPTHRDIVSDMHRRLANWAISTEGGAPSCPLPGQPYYDIPQPMGKG